MANDERMTNDESSGPVRAPEEHLVIRTLSLAVLLVTLLFGLVFTAGCGSTTHHKWLTFFFDGVPQPGAVTNAAPPRLAATRSTNVAQVAVAQPVKPTLFIHPPYAQRECTTCHESAYSQKMKGKPGDICFTCHKNFQPPAKVKHQPFENGECASCHSPHQANNTKLLLKTGATLCADCHDDIPKQIAKAKVKHQPVENGECLSCHNPHQSANKKLLAKPDGKLCFDCHDDLQTQIAKAKVKHQPVENGECASCHNPHLSDNKKLLLKPGGKMCFECHDDMQQAMAKAKSTHQPAADGDCGSCHNPHATNNSKLLNKAVPAICGDCHEDADLQKVREHRSAPDKSACSSCHDPHQSGRPHLLKTGA